MSRDTSDLLEAIVAATRRSVATRRERVPLHLVERRAAAARPDGDRFAAALARRDRLNVIAECKRRSPSRGVLRPEYDPAAIAREYEAAGAAAVSVLTETAFFDGTLAHLQAVRQAVALPLLRKDFIVDEYQLFEARAAGADAVLLIVAALGRGPLAALASRARDLGLAQLVEAHTRQEVEDAVRAGATLIGVNNRNLRTMQVDLDASATLRAAIPGDVVAVAESGLRSSGDLRRLKAAGYDAFLVGERLVCAGHPGAALAELLPFDSDAVPTPNGPASRRPPGSAECHPK